VWLLAGVGAIGIGADPAITLTPPLSDGFGRGSELVGVFASSFGVGAGARSWADPDAPLARPPPARDPRSDAARDGHARPDGRAGRRPLAIVAFGVGGAGMTFSLTSLSTQMQERLPDVPCGAGSWPCGRSRSSARGRSPPRSTAPSRTPWSVEAALLTVVTVLLVATWLSRPSRLAPVPLASTPDAPCFSPANRS
jgi:hypothetical protein